ncbi:MAG: hypothetical protein JWM37_455 [Candidatus Saccharibacteria bacterium]|nr:hypothetical protein [Candidatus Saccharibacteria bacterium]
MSNHTPYETLGTHLRQMREQQQESLAEVSGAVEIDIDALESIEAGQVRPSEDILLLLINHFDAQDHEAVRLWELAGYEEPPVDRAMHPHRMPTMMIVAIDVRTMYSDGVQITGNDAGLVMQFMQQSAANQSAPVARVGMSYDQAQKVLEALQASLLRAKYMRGPKGLPQPKNDL